MKKIILIFILAFSFVHASFIKDLGINNKDINAIKFSKNKKYIFNRLSNFKKLKEDLKNEKNKNRILHRVNNFFNKFSSIRDYKNYKKIDYWASRKEFLIKGKGDCEDYVIAKYFTLLELGFKSKDFSILQVEYKNELHLVLSYNKNNQKTILDNVNKSIKTLTQRSDLKELYEIQAFSLNTKHTHTYGHLVSYKWHELLKRINNN